MCSAIDGETVVRGTKAGLTMAIVMALAALAACGAEKASGPGATSGRPTTLSGPDKPLSKGALNQAAVTGKELEGYAVEFKAVAPSVTHRTADPAACAPIVHALGTGSGFPATARIGRHIFSKKHGPGATMTLSSYSPGNATRVIDALRTAVKRCQTFQDVQVGFRYEGVALRPDRYGDDSVSLRLTQLTADSENEQPVRVPCAVVAVRQGTTVAMFYEYNRPGGPRGKDPAAVPEAIIKAQLAKLSRPTASQ